MKKIGIFTWYKGTNYGSILQATALSSVIKSLSYDAIMINYLDKGNYDSENAPYYSISKLFNKIIEKLFRKKNDYRRLEECDKFVRKYLDETSTVDSWVELRQISESFDGVICGSDQIWSPLCYDDNNYLPFVNSEKKMAYCPSLGSTEICNSEIAERMKKQISGFKHISVREKTGAEIIKKLTGKSPEVVLDPTLLLNKNEWANLVCLKEKKDEEIVFCYLLGPYKRYRSILKKIVKNIKQDICIVCDSYHGSDNHIKKIEGVGPQQFLQLINNSKFFITDSFHGTAFSVSFHTPFLSLARFDDDDNHNQNSRIIDFLSDIDLLDYFIYPNQNKIHLNFDINFLKADLYLARMRESSKEYLKKALNDITNSTENKNKPFNITESCSGCGACTTVCPTKAATLELNKLGFWHFKINYDMCINCRKCQEVCPFYNCNNKSIKEIKGLYAYRSIHNAAEKSSSGGAGFDISLMALANGYNVFGSKYNIKNNRAEHICIKPNEISKIKDIQKSKYIQSYSEYALNKIHSMDINEKICFFGTPCQCAAVNNILIKKNLRSSALIVDLICHGVPSYKLWEKELSHIKKNIGQDNLSEVYFRGGYHHQVLSMEAFVDGKKIYCENEFKDPFYMFFKYGLCYADSCYECAYRNQSAADIRIGDYWGPRFEGSNKKTSMICAITENGLKVVQQLKQTSSYFVETETQEYWQIQTTTNTHKPSFYYTLLSELSSEESIEYLAQKYCKNYLKKEKIRRVSRIIRKAIHI